jgi:glutamate-1-semialdehyde aminotransferase
VLKHVAPWASSVRFTKTGSEATHAAYRVAKKATGRTKVLMHNRAYHGWHEWCQVDSVCRFEYGDTVVASEDWKQYAAIFVEPLRFHANDAEWLRSVREHCDHHGILLVFDSMIYGGRHAFGGTSDYFGIVPDMETYGKAFGNGEAVAFVVGRDALQEHGEVASGTYSGCATGLQAVLDTLHTYTTEPVIETLWVRGKQLADGLDQVLANHPGLAAREGQPVHQRVRFVADHAGQAKQFTQAMAARGVLWHPDVANVCFSHTAQQIDAVIAAAAESLKEIE